MRVLLIHPALAPYRLDQFNRLAKICDLTVAFLYDNVWNHPFDQKVLLGQAKFRHVFLLRGPEYKGRVLRWGMVKLIKSIDPQIIVSYEFSFSTQFLVGLRALGIIKCKIGSTIDDSLDICHQIQSPLRRLARSIAVARLDFLVVLSEDIAKFYASRYEVSASGIVVSPILQDPARLRQSGADQEKIASEHIRSHRLGGKKVVLFVGRFIPEKGLARFIRNVSGILKSEPDTTLVLVGDGVERESISRTVVEAGLESQVLLAGRFEGTQLFAWYVAASGFVLPSTYEPFGAVIDEALIFGLPVLCSKSAGSASLALEGGGSLFDPHNVDETKQAFRVFLKGLKPVDIPRMSDRLPLTGRYAEGFNSQWEKVLGR